MQKPGFDIPAYKDSVSFETYRLRAGDRLYIKVYSIEKENNALFNGSAVLSQSMMSGSGALSDLYTYLINEDGSVVFPVIGPIVMSGLTVREATAKLEKELEPVMRYSTTVEMRIVNRQFSVIGGGKSGYYTMPREKINIFQALAMSGDINIYGDRSKIRILRETADGPVIKSFDARSADIIHSEFFYIESNDVIYIQTLSEQFFSIMNLPTLFTTTVSTFSFGLLIYNTINKFIPNKPAE